jgi:hypothetical protein
MGTRQEPAVASRRRAASVAARRVAVFHALGAGAAKAEGGAFRTDSTGRGVLLRRMTKSLVLSVDSAAR